MNPPRHNSRAGPCTATALAILILLSALFPAPARAINIVLDYRYDTNNFFNTQQKKDALQAAANRYSAVITESLLGATLSNNSQDPRIGFTHPATGFSWEVSPATGIADDALASCTNCYPANEYRQPWSIPANQMIVYAGGRPLAGTTAGEASSATGLNFTTVFNSSTSHLNRGFRSTGGSNYLPLWGGAITFDNDGSTVWHYNHNTAAPAGATDFYSIALHEIGHLLGLSTSWNEWASLSSGNLFYGPNTVAAYNADNGAALASLNRASAGDPHFQDNTYDSYIFENASPNLVGTVGADAKQDLLMEPIANFTGAIRRFELTNTDAAALRDMGWSTVPQIDSQPGDYNENGVVDAADYVVFAKGLADNNYATWKANFGESTPAAANAPHLAAVPEPASCVILLITLTAFAIHRAR